MIINVLVNFRGIDWILNLVFFRIFLNFWWDGYILFINLNFVNVR